MMYVFTNLKTPIKNFDVIEVDGKKQIKTKVDNITIIGREKEMDCNIFVIENVVDDEKSIDGNEKNSIDGNSVDGNEKNSIDGKNIDGDTITTTSNDTIHNNTNDTIHNNTTNIDTIDTTPLVINIDKIYPAKVIECEIEYETGVEQDEFNVTDLVKSFGSKKNIERLKNVEIDGYLKKPNVKNSTKTQILPMMREDMLKGHSDGCRSRSDSLHGEDGLGSNVGVSSGVPSAGIDGHGEEMNGIAEHKEGMDAPHNNDHEHKHDYEHNDINKKTSLPNIFKLEDMFSKQVLDEFYKITKFELCNETKRFYDGTNNNKLRILLLDCLIRLLSFKYVTKDVFDDSPYKSFSCEFAEDIEIRKLSKLSRDRFIIKVYILILQIEGGQVLLSAVPSFNMSVDTVLSYFQVLGCIYNKNTNEIKMVTKPMEYTRK